jgi:hypothetical protein
VYAHRQPTAAEPIPTFLDGLIQLRGWLAAEDVTVVAMEATSSYWLPVWRVLEESERSSWCWLTPAMSSMCLVETLT